MASKEFTNSSAYLTFIKKQLKMCSKVEHQSDHATLTGVSSGKIAADIKILLDKCKGKVKVDFSVTDGINGKWGRINDIEGKCGTSSYWPILKDGKIHKAGWKVMAESSGAKFKCA